MNRFAALLDRLSYEPRRNAKIRLMADYFSHTPDPERGWALAALTGSLSFRHAKPGLIRGLAEERMDPTLFYLSWDYVGDLSETVALMWPRALPSPLRGGAGGGGQDVLQSAENKAPTLTSAYLAPLSSDPLNQAGRPPSPTLPRRKSDVSD